MCSKWLCFRPSWFIAGLPQATRDGGRTVFKCTAAVVCLFWREEDRVKLPPIEEQVVKVSISPWYASLYASYSVDSADPNKRQIIPLISLAVSYLKTLGNAITLAWMHHLVSQLVLDSWMCQHGPICRGGCLCNSGQLLTGSLTQRCLLDSIRLLDTKRSNSERWVIDQAITISTKVTLQ
jgi:hypothetical protein